MIKWDYKGDFKSGKVHIKYSRDGGGFVTIPGFDGVNGVSQGTEAAPGEGSGTYMLRNALVAAGCFADGRTDGIHEDYKFETMPDLLAVRRSYYHGGRRPDLKAVFSQLIVRDYRVVILFITRDSYATARSLLARLPTSDETTLNNCLSSQEESFLRIAEFWSAYRDFPAKFIMVSYEAFCLTPGYRKWLFEDMLRLTNPVDFEIKYANDKYYE